MAVSPAKTAKKPRSSSGWSEQRRARHAAAIKIWAPWAKSTGPRTPAGKKRSAMNAYKHGNRDATARLFEATLARNSRFLRNVVLYGRLRKNNRANELLKDVNLALRKEGLHITGILLALLHRMKTSRHGPNCVANDG